MVSRTEDTTLPFLYVSLKIRVKPIVKRQIVRVLYETLLP